MTLHSRRVLDRALTIMGLVSIGLVIAALVALLLPITVRGLGAIVFRSTVEWRRLQSEEFQRGDSGALAAELAAAQEARAPVYEMIAAFEAQLDEDREMRQEYRRPLREVKEILHRLLGPEPGARRATLPRERYGQTRWDRAEVHLERLLHTTEWVQTDPSLPAEPRLVPRGERFAGTSLEPLFGYVENNIGAMLRPRWTFYWRFLIDRSLDSHIFGGIGAEVLGTLYLTIGAILFAVPLGVLTAIYLVEYARQGWIISTLRMFINTLAGVPSIVFGLFGLAFFINTIHVSDTKSTLAGALTLAVLVLPLVIRASEEALRAVPLTYREAALSLGASRWKAVVSVVLPASLPGIITGVVIAMGRAAGETAPIIFTAAVSVGQPLRPWETLTQPTPALPWNIYNLATEHPAVDEIRHVQYGMVFTLVALVLLLNFAAIVIRARVSRKQRG
ncbi:phosphate ABC transporter permease PstA [Candidatus Sumerlaeota bacterium]|nr:phosphate ABC transporter permease PstA [Candidatus Sumerlaeota bacterium]